LSSYACFNNNPIFYSDVNGKESVVVVYGEGREVKARNGKIYIMYDVEVYHNMNASEYNIHKTNGTLPAPNYRTELARDAHDITSKGKTVIHSDLRYGSNNETPPWYLFLV
jgi:hypothetical protein